MPRPRNFFEQLAGVAVHYARYSDPQYGYGTRGKPYKFYCLENFENKLNKYFEELWDVCPLGIAEVITSAGTYVDKRGAHGQGRGIDLDAIFWTDRSFITLNYPQDRAFYLGVESILRKHFGVVLNYAYNDAHHDHIHIDDTAPIGFSASRKSIAYFVQMILTDVFAMPVAIDGCIGSQTNTALRQLLVQLTLATSGEIDNDESLHIKLKELWLPFLDIIAQKAFAAEQVVTNTPLTLLQDVYAVIEQELNGDEKRKRIEAALTTFATHEDSAAFLEQYR